MQHRTCVDNDASGQHVAATGLLVGPLGQSEKASSMQALAKQLSVFAGVTELRDGLVKRGMRDIICDKLQMLIASGVLQVGDVLPGERELAAALGVSRETVRGAVQTLSVRGILEVSHGARTRVVSAEVGPITIGIGKPKALDSYDIDTVHG